MMEKPLTINSKDRQGSGPGTEHLQGSGYRRSGLPDSRPREAGGFNGGSSRNDEDSLIVESNTIYELDLACIQKKRNRKK